MEIRRAYTIREEDLAGRDFSFQVTEELAQCSYITICGRTIVTRPVPTYQKTYGFDPEDFVNLDDPDRALFVLDRGGEIFGYALGERAWNGMVTLEDIALDVQVRGQGYGKRLVSAVVEWARDLGVAGVRAETQSNNVAACRLYKGCGFSFGGYDRFLYRGTEHKDEVALFWYYLLDSGGEPA